MDLEDRERTNRYRLVMLGATGVGKSSITLRLVKDEFREYSQPTVGAAFLTASFKIGDKTVKLDLWDTAGQERFASLAPMYYRTAQVAVVAYDVCDRKSLSRALDWVKELRTQAPSETLIILCGNKVDMADRREVSPQEGQDAADDKGLMFSEVSAKTGQGIKNMFHRLAENLAKDKNGENANIFGGGQRNVHLERGYSTSNKCSC